MKTCLDCQGRVISKCEICKKPICYNCIKQISVRIARVYRYAVTKGSINIKSHPVTSTPIILCKKCYDRIERKQEGDNEMLKNISINFMQNKFSLEELEQ